MYAFCIVEVVLTQQLQYKIRNKLKTKRLISGQRFAQLFGVGIPGVGREEKCACS
jgi:hypothetical protein